MQTKIGEVISRVRNNLKSVRQDAFMTDRYIFSLLKKQAELSMKRQDEKNRLMAFSSIFRVLNCVELIEVDRLESNCVNIKTGNTVMRTKDKMNIFLQGFWGPLIRSITSLDGSIELQPTNPSTYAQISSSTSFKYNKTLYYWYLNDYLYFPNLTWDKVRIEGVLLGDGGLEPCDIIQDQPFSVPEHLFSEIEGRVIQEIMSTMSIPSDNLHNNENVTR